MERKETGQNKLPLFFAKGEVLQDLSLLFAIFAGLLFLICFPSFRISKYVEARAPIGIPDFIESGSLFIIDGTPNTYQIRVSGKLMTPIFENVSLLGGVGINQRNSVVISGMYQTREKDQLNTFRRFFAHQTISGFKKIVQVSPSDEIEEAKKLRLPSSVWKKVSTGKKDRKQIERTILRNALKNVSKLTNFKCWNLPLSTKITSEFGSPRTLPNGKRYYHSGLDLRAKRPTPILAMGGGEVVVAKKMIVPGNIVVIDHGGGLFSRYFHLSRLDVEEGKDIFKGQQLGLSGSTGRVNGPHLHWEVIWKGQPVNPLQALKAWKTICEEGRNLSASSFQVN